MNDLEKYVGQRRERDGEFSAGYREGYEEFKTGFILKTLRLRNGMTQKELAEKNANKRGSGIAHGKPRGRHFPGYLNAGRRAVRQEAFRYY